MSPDGPPPFGPLVDATWLLGRVRAGDPDLVLLDCRFRLENPAAGRALYAAGHLPGAVFADLERDLSAPPRTHGGRHPLPDPTALAIALGRWGVGPRSAAVAYDDGACAPRCWWLLRWLGHDRVAVLDGGMAAWLAVGGPLTTEVPSPVPAHFVPRPRPEMVVDVEAVRRRPAGTVLIDARAPERFRGESEPLDRVAGRIPGAVNVPWTEGIGPDGRWRDAAAQRRRFAAVPAGAPVIAYCGSGITACADLLAMELAGLPPGRLYPGSFSDWVSYPENPVEKG